MLDCQVSDWSQWSECDAACGAGVMSRSRQIVQSSQNGGKHCPTLTQKRDCQGYHCHPRNNKKIMHGKSILDVFSFFLNHNSLNCLSFSFFLLTFIRIEFIWFMLYKVKIILLFILIKLKYNLWNTRNCFSQFFEFNK